MKQINRGREKKRKNTEMLEKYIYCIPIQKNNMLPKGALMVEVSTY
jgi:hypothetical protein